MGSPCLGDGEEEDENKYRYREYRDRTSVDESRVSAEYSRAMVASHGWWKNDSCGKLSRNEFDEIRKKYAKIAKSEA